MGELDFIKWIRKHVKSKKSVLIGIGDDSAEIDISNENSLIITTDTILDGTHFRRKECTPKQIGRKAITCSISDIAAMGCKPLYALVSISFPKETDEKFGKEVYSSILTAAEKYNVQIIGGNIVSGECPLNINVTIIGAVLELEPVKRSGAKPDDIIMVTGRLGGSILGKHLWFEPRIFEGMSLRKDFCVNSMIDISDGLLIDLSHILAESRLGAVIDEDKIPISHDAFKLSKTTKRSPIFHAMTDGEDYELLFTVSETKANEILRSDAFNIPITPIGYIREKNGLFIRDIDGNERFVSPKGYEHLFSLA